MDRCGSFLSLSLYVYVYVDNVWRVAQDQIPDYVDDDVPPCMPSLTRAPEKHGFLLCFSKVRYGRMGASRRVRVRVVCVMCKFNER